MSLVSLQNVEVSFGGEPLLLNANLVIEKGDRIGVMGRNGVGKSTLLNLLSGVHGPDDGIVSRDEGTSVGMLTQMMPAAIEGTVTDVVADHATDRNVYDAEKIITRLRLDPTAKFDSLSGGQKRRVMLARALVSQPDLLLLDEPTNHLDIESISWLEGYLRAFQGAIVLITHDRRFLKKVVAKVVDLDRGVLSVWPGNYENYLKRKQALLASEENQRHVFQKKLKQEEHWIREGISARRRRNQGRVRRLMKMRDERRAQRQVMGRVKAEIHLADRSGKIVLEAENICYRIGDLDLVKNFSTTIQRGDRVAVIGPNGTGKTTLVNLLRGELTPDSGEVKRGAKIEIAYFDQHKLVLNEKLTALENVAGGQEQLAINGKTKHIISYMQDFLFAPDRARAPITALSGGERSRLLLARLFAQPSNLLIMDEPTNDLDVETLELLEELLLDYTGTLLLVSHDREFIDQVATHVFAFEGDGCVKQYIGGYDDWLRQRPVTFTAEKSRKSKQATEAVKKMSEPASRKKLSYNEQRELTMLPAQIEELENQLEALQTQMSKPDFFKQTSSDIAAVQRDFNRLQTELENAFERWSLLETAAT